MDKDKIDNLRDRLYSLIAEEADYCDILKASEELDDYIYEFISEKSDSTSYK